MAFKNMSEVRAIDNLDEMTGIIKNELNNITEGFVAVGYYLKKTAKDELYKQKGYQNLFEYAKESFGISRPTAIRFMEINDTYSIGGFSPEIDERWRGYGSSKLTEMLGLPGEIREEIPAEATVKEIRETKAIIRETEDKYSPQMNMCDVAQEQEEPAEWMKELVRELFRTEKKAFEQMVDYTRRDIGNDEKGITEDILLMVNPSKFKMVRLKKANAMMVESGIRVMPYKVNGEVPASEEFTYIDFAMAFEEVFFPNYPDVSGSVQSIYEREYGEPLYEKKEEPEKKETAKKDERGSVHKNDKPAKKEVKKKENPKREPEEPVKAIEEPLKATEEPDTPEADQEEAKDEQIPGQTELTKDFPEYCPEEMLNPPEEPVKRAYASRLLYMASIGDEEAAAYMARIMEEKIRGMKNVSFSILTKSEFWEEFMKAEVDKEGREIECV